MQANINQQQQVNNNNQGNSPTPGEITYDGLNGGLPLLQKSYSFLMIQFNRHCLHWEKYISGN